MPGVAAFISGFVAGISPIYLGGAGAIGFGAGVAAANFLTSTLLGNLLLNVGLAYLTRPGQSDRPDVEAARVNSRIPDPERFQLGGPVAVGGAAGIFGEFDEDGNFWYIIAHGDAELTGDPTYLLDGIEVTLSDGTDGFTAGDVLTDDFCLDDDEKIYEGSGTRRPWFRLYTVTPDSSSVYGAKPSAFTTAFANLPADFYLAGVCYTIVRVQALGPKYRHLIYRWRGPMGLGEPSLTLYGDFNRMYDPREVGHDIDDDTTWTASAGNPALVWAWWRTHEFGRNRPMSEVNWTKVAEAADICDELVTNRSGGDVPRYRCGIAARDARPRHEVEQEILKTCDGFVAYDDEGKAYPVVGDYVAPTLSFTSERDIVTAATEIVDDGEQPVDGVVVRYISPDHGYTKQPCAPWQNPTYYVAGREPNYQFVDILGCQDHNQAFRLAGAIGARIGAPKKAALGTTIKGILAKSERAIDLGYDTEFDGVFEIATPVEEDPNGMACAFAVVPLASNRWDGAGQSEGVPPAPTPALNIDDSLEVASNVAVTSEPVQTDTGAAVRLKVTFDAPARVDRFIRFRYTEDGGSVYEYFAVDMDELQGFSAIVKDGQAYDVQWQTVTAGGRATDWAADVGGGETVYDITAVANATAPDDLISASATGGTGQATLEWTTANDADQFAVEIRRGPTTTFGDASLISTVVTPANTTGSADDTGLSAGTYYYWMTPINGSGVQGTHDGPYSAVVS